MAISKKKASSKKETKRAQGGSVQVKSCERDNIVLAALNSFLAAQERDALRLAESISDSLRKDCAPIDSNISFYDLRDKQDFDYPSNARKARFHGSAPLMRDPSTIDTIVVHQTGIEFGVSEHAIKKNKGDKALALATRALDVASHVMSFRSGFFVASHPLLAYLNSSGVLNARSCAIEIEGNYSGLEDDLETLAREDLKTIWKGQPTELTDKTIEASKEAIRFLVKEGKSIGINFKQIATHRQSSESRRADPGEAIYKKIILPIAEELNLKITINSFRKNARTVPKNWDEQNGIGEY